MATIFGTANDDLIVFGAIGPGVSGPPTQGADLIYARGGDDLVQAAGGNDTILGEAGRDLLFGEEGDDVIDGGSGDDSMRGGLGNDVYAVDNAFDNIVENAGEGIDTIYASIGFVITSPNVEIGRLSGTANYLELRADLLGPITLVVNPSVASTLGGGGGSDVLYGGRSGAVLFGRGGDDVMYDQFDPAQMLGGVGNDQYVVGSAGSVLTELAGEGIDTAWVTVNGYTLSPNIEIGRLGREADSLYGSESAEQLVANPNPGLAGSKLFGNGGNDVLWGGPGLDMLNGGPGDDTLRGQGNLDDYFGGTGNDHFVVFDVSTNIFELADEGYDTVWLSFTGAPGFTMPANVERVNAGNANSVVCTGNDLDNVIVGSAVARNFLRGEGGNDTMYGGTGFDTYFASSGNDTTYCGGGASGDSFVYDPGDSGIHQIAHLGAAAPSFSLSGGRGAYGDIVFSYGNGNTQVQFLDTTILLFGATIDIGAFSFN